MEPLKQEHNGTKELEIQARKNKVWTLFVQGYSQQKIAEKLGVSLKTISRDFQELKTTSKEWLDALPEGEAQLYHMKNFEAIQRVSEELWNLFEKTKDENKKLNILNQIADKAKLQSEMMVKNNSDDIRGQIQHELKIKNRYGQYPHQRMD